MKYCFFPANMKCIVGLMFIICSGFVSTYVIFPIQTIPTSLDTRSFYNFFYYRANHITAHPKDETKFILSIHGFNHTMLCPFGTKFDTKLSICNYKWSSPHWMEKNSIASDNLAKDSEDKEYKKWLDGCSPFDEMPYFNKSTNTYDCFPTLDVGPCKPKEWFVLNKDNPKYATCEEQKCACGPDYEYDYYELGDSESEEENEKRKEEECLTNIGDDGYTFLDFNGECVEAKDQSKCDFGQWLVPNVFGEAECFCADNYLPDYYQNGSLKACYQEFLQGPCKEGEQYNKTEGDYSFVGKCVATTCDDTNQIQYNETCVTIPDCKENQGIKLPSEKHLEAKCKNGLGERTGLINGSKSCGAGKRKDSKGNCVKRFGSNKKKPKRSPGAVAGDVGNHCCG